MMSRIEMICRIQWAFYVVSDGVKTYILANTSFTEEFE